MTCGHVGEAIIVGNDIQFKYAIGSVLYDCCEARKGILEKVAIKEVMLNPSYGAIVPLYVDTFNAFHNEGDLCEQAERRYFSRSLLRRSYPGDR